MQKLRSIQVLRAVAALAVAAMHSYQQLNAPVGLEGYGAFGVDLFFVISGFIMASVSRGRSAGDFLRDRLWRIYPIWWIAVLPWLLILSPGQGSVASSLSLWPIFADGFHVPVLTVGWTLSFELLFYLGVTVALCVGVRLPLIVYALCLVGALMTSSALLDFVGSPMALEFLAGAIVAKLPRRSVFGTFILVGIALLILTSPTTGSARAALVAESAIWRAVEWGVPAALIVWGAVSLARLFDSRLFDPFVAMGDASYSIYLFHSLIAYGLDIAWPLRLAIAVLLGWSMHVLIERRIPAGRKALPRLIIRLRHWLGAAPKTV